MTNIIRDYWEVIVFFATVIFFSGVIWLKADEAKQTAEKADIKATQAAVDVVAVKKDIEYLVAGMKLLLQEKLDESNTKTRK